MSTNKTDLSKYNNTILGMTYDISISGTKLSYEKKQCITSIDIVETVEGSDSATIKIEDPDFLYIDDNIFIEDNAINISLGWSGFTYRVNFEGYISAIDINFEQSGIPSLTVVCMDNTHKMNRKKKSRTFKNTTNASVVKKIVKEYGFTYVGESNYKFTKKDSISQSNQTDIDFITKLAGDEVHPFTARLVGKKFYFVKMGKLTTPKMELTYRNYPHDIISFSPKINKESKQKETTKSSVSSSNKGVSTTSSSKGNSSSSSISKSGSSSKNSPTNKSANSSYTYNPKTRKWNKNN